LRVAVLFCVAVHVAFTSCVYANVATERVGLAAFVFGALQFFAAEWDTVRTGVLFHASFTRATPCHSTRIRRSAAILQARAIVAGSGVVVYEVGAARRVVGRDYAAAVAPLGAAGVTTRTFVVGAVDADLAAASHACG
jgi:hypothetical protein